METSLDHRLDGLARRGVRLIDPRQVYVADDVDLDRIHRGAVLHPGTRLQGPRTLIAPDAEIGIEGPAVLDNAVIGRAVEVASGYLNDAVLLDRARAGANAHFRGGTLLEEEASTAHAVGLKHTILMCFVTAGSLINFCDGLVSGGRSRQDHSEIGSGFIHFNFTPWGKRGDKATASLIGSVAEGVLLDRDRIFLGGLSGLVGPQQVGFGAFTVAGQVIREPVAAKSIHSKAVTNKVGPWQFGRVDRSKERARRNIRYIGQLTALLAWYREVRLPRARDHQADPVLADVLSEAIGTIAVCIDERVSRFNAFAGERGFGRIDFRGDQAVVPPLPMALGASNLDHVSWVYQLRSADREVIRGWLAAVTAETDAALAAQTGLG